MPSITIKSQDVLPAGTSFSAYDFKKIPGRDKNKTGATDATGTIGATTTTISFAASGDYIVTATVNGQERRVHVSV